MGASLGFWTSFFLQTLLLVEIRANGMKMRRILLLSKLVTLLIADQMH